jgi:hypothetical protein
MLVMTEPKMRTVCHRCRDMQVVRAVDRDGVMKARYVPDGDPSGVIIRLVATAGGHQAIQQETCPDCGGTGWLDGFVPPC